MDRATSNHPSSAFVRSCVRKESERIQHLQNQKPEPGPIWDSDVPPHYLIFQSERKQKQGQGPCLISSQKTRCKGNRHNYPEGGFFFFLRYYIEKKVTDQSIYFFFFFLKKRSQKYQRKQEREKRVLKHKK